MHVVVGIEDLLGPSARSKWDNTPKDIQELLRYAFDYAIRHKEKVRQYEREERRRCEVRRFGQRVHLWVEIRRMEIGDAIFWIAIGRNIPPVIVDFSWVEVSDLEPWP